MNMLNKNVQRPTTTLKKMFGNAFQTTRATRRECFLITEPPHWRSFVNKPSWYFRCSEYKTRRALNICCLLHNFAQTIQKSREHIVNEDSISNRFHLERVTPFLTNNVCKCLYKQDARCFRYKNAWERTRQRIETLPRWTGAMAGTAIENWKWKKPAAERHRTAPRMHGNSSRSRSSAEWTHWRWHVLQSSWHSLMSHGPRGTSLKENATRDNNKIGDGRERRGRLEKRRSKKKCISKRGITIFRACVPIQKIPHFLMYWPSSNWKSPQGGLSNLRLRDVEKQPLAKIKHAWS